MITSFQILSDYVLVSPPTANSPRESGGPYHITQEYIHMRVAPAVGRCVTHHFEVKRSKSRSHGSIEFLQLGGGIVEDKQYEFLVYSHLRWRTQEISSYKLWHCLFNTLIGLFGVNGNKGTFQNVTKAVINTFVRPQIQNIYDSMIFLQTLLKSTSPSDAKLH